MRKRLMVLVVLAVLSSGCSVWHELWANTGGSSSTAAERRRERIERSLDRGDLDCRCKDR